MAKGRKTGGRTKGTPNKLTVGVKEAILAAFDELGGSSYLVSVGKENPAVFCQLVGKVLPLTLAGGISVKKDASEYSDEELAAIATAGGAGAADEEEGEGGSRGVH